MSHRLSKQDKETLLKIKGFKKEEGFVMDYSRPEEDYMLSMFISKEEWARKTAEGMKYYYWNSNTESMLDFSEAWELVEEDLWVEFETESFEVFHNKCYEMIEKYNSSDNEVNYLKIMTDKYNKLKADYDKLKIDYNNLNNKKVSVDLVNDYMRSHKKIKENPTKIVLGVEKYNTLRKDTSFQSYITVDWLNNVYFLFGMKIIVDDSITGWYLQ